MKQILGYEASDGTVFKNAADCAVHENALKTPGRMLRLRQVLAIFPISRSGWYAGVKAGKYPAPIKTGPRTAMWRASDIDALLAAMAQ